ncbi:MAG TPA: trypsin-like peptidase domain-containing protein [Acidimicrobiia bacterium]|nr:trypsin-like peptidase domain-containing protein [Acidimicrobiia bacterium]
MPPPGSEQPPAPPPVWGDPAASPARPRATGRILVGVVVLALALGGGVAVGAALRPTASSAPTTSPTTHATTPPAAPAGASATLDVQGIANGVDPAVVDINTNLTGGNGAAGTGMIISPTGMVLTNNHVVADETTISVRSVTTGHTYGATVVGYDSTDDVALVQLKGASGLPTITPAKAAPLLIGQPVVAIGNALGQGGTPSATGGVVAAVNQTVTASDNGQNPETLHGMIQTDAPIQPGDSGGPMVNPSGQVVGMDTAATTNSGGLQQATSGQAGFAIPIGTALTIVHEIAAGQAVPNVHLGARALLGVEIATNTSNAGSGAPVSRVEPNTPAASVGIAAGSLITSFNGTPIANGTDLTNVIAPLQAGAQATVGWTDRSGQQHSATVTLIAGPPA